MDFLLTRGLDSGLDSTDVYIYKGALLPVELLRLQHFIYFFGKWVISERYMPLH